MTPSVSRFITLHLQAVWYSYSNVIVASTAWTLTPTDGTSFRHHDATCRKYERNVAQDKHRWECIQHECMNGSRSAFMWSASTIMHQTVSPAVHPQLLMACKCRPSHPSQPTSEPAISWWASAGYPHCISFSIDFHDRWQWCVVCGVVCVPAWYSRHIWTLHTPWNHEVHTSSQKPSEYPQALWILLSHQRHKYRRVSCGRFSDIYWYEALFFRLITIMLGRLKMSTKEALQLQQNLQQGVQCWEQ